MPLTSTEELSSIAGYVQQEDMFIGYLKVKEQLRFQVHLIHQYLNNLNFCYQSLLVLTKAHLKMGKDNSAEEKDARVEQILVEVGYFCIHVHLKV